MLSGLVEEVPLAHAGISGTHFWVPPGVPSSLRESAH